MASSIRSARSALGRWPRLVRIKRRKRSDKDKRTCSSCSSNIQSDPRVMPCGHRLCGACNGHLTGTSQEMCLLCQNSLSWHTAELEPSDFMASATENWLVISDASTASSDLTPDKKVGTCDHRGRDLSDVDDNSEEVLDGSVCLQHQQCLTAYCKQCDVAICESCWEIGEHSDHEPVHLLDDETIQWREDLLQKAGNLNSDISTHFAKALDVIEDIEGQLDLRTDKIVQEIIAAGRLAVEAVESCVQQKLQEVRTILARRRKGLNESRDELNRCLRNVSQAIDFGGDLQKLDIRCVRSSSDYLSLEKCLSDLNEAKLTAMPVSNTGAVFQPASPEVIQTRVSDIVGTVFTCLASPRHSSVVGVPGPTRHLAIGQQTQFFVEVCDGLGECPIKGADVVCVQWKNIHVDDIDNAVAEVENRGNGQYVITCALRKEGVYSFEVLVNGKVLKHPIEMNCHGLWAFDSNTCSEEGLTVSDDRCTVTHSGVRAWKWVVADKCMTGGIYSWTVKIKCSKKVDNFLGVAVKGKLGSFEGNYRQTYSWTNDGRKRVLSKSESCMNDWRDGDVLVLEMNCDTHMLTITNQRSKESSCIPDLPSEELVPYVGMYYTRSCVTFVQ